MQLTIDYGEPYTNRGLFADHFLQHRLDGLPAWRDPAGLSDALAALRALYQRAATLSQTTNEAQTERDLVRPVLDLLWRETAPGDCYQVQVSLPNLGASTRQPDYALFRSAADRDAAEEHKGTLDYWTGVACVGDAKRWSSSLDQQRGEENPSAQLTNYLYRSKVRWGILTNGRQWRLYEQETSRAGGVYFEVDLVELLNHGRLDDFRWFFHFFRRGALLPDQTGKSFLEQVLEGSVTYAAEVGDRLKDSVYDALRLLINGFLDHPGNRLDRHDPATLRRVHDNALIVLYRLLFLFYAEDRKLLPYERDPYAEVSLYGLHRAVNGRLRGGRGYTPATQQIWARLMDLFKLIDQGYAEGGIPEYNGGLFDPGKHPHVAYVPQDGQRRWSVSDDPLAQVIDLLAYDRESGASVGHSDIDYATLAVQHLGSIYEGLLELQPCLAVEPLVEVVRGNNATFEPAATVARPNPQARRISTDGVYLATDRGERKASGSYYTPKYIVDYIVEQTIDPLVVEAAGKVAALRPEVEQRAAELEQKRRSIPEFDQATRRQLAVQIEAQRARLLEPYLSLKVLDPAMGSGHFLVGAADFLSLAMATDPNLPALAAMGDEDPQIFFKRMVVERCLYGVDLNPLAVELAKLSLWLHTVSGDKALSFLDHHLRCGNSLIGARLMEDLSTEPPRLKGGKVVRDNRDQMTFAFTETLRGKHLSYFLDTFRQIAEAPAGDPETERAKAKWYEAMDQVRDRFRQVADLWLAPYFGVEVTPEEYGRAVEALAGTTLERDGVEVDPFSKLIDEAWFTAAHKVGTEKCFFHWELEFPEAFLAPNGPLPEAERGFDAVIGNPPYVSNWALRASDPEMNGALEARYPGVLTSHWDLYIGFVYQGTKLTSPSGLAGFILPTPFAVEKYATALRQWILSEASLVGLTKFGQLRVFGEVARQSLIALIAPNPSVGNLTAIEEFEGDTFTPKGQVGRSVWRSLPNSAFRPDVTPDCIAVKQLVDEQSAALGTICCVNPGVVAHSGSHSPIQFVKDDALGTARPDSGWKPYLQGEDLARYACHWRGLYLDYEARREHFHRAKFPELFESSKLMVRGISGEHNALIACLDHGQFFTNHSIIHIATWTPKLAELQSPGPYTIAADGYDIAYIGAICLSRLATWYFSLFLATGTLQGSYTAVYPEDLRQLPVRRIEFCTPADLRHVGAEGIWESYLAADATGVLTQVAADLAATPPCMDVVHDVLARLAAELTALYQLHRAEISGFLTWLEGHMGAKVDELSNKTKLRAYHEHDYDTVHGVLKANRRKLNADPVTREFTEHLRAEYDRSVAKLHPLLARIEATDRLIDQIVYQLYGLTDDEIALVEGKVAEGRLTHGAKDT